MKWLIRTVIIAGIVLLALMWHRQEGALTSCLHDVQNECGGLLSYVFSLEEENAKLNRELERCLDKGR